jgi:ERCC4-type nuclease
MIFLTTAANDQDLVKHFRGMGVTAPIPYGDFIFSGVWTGGERISVCGERKHIPDLIQCINDGRHLEQIRGAREAGFRFIFLVVEDIYREDSSGGVEYRRGQTWRTTNIECHRIDSYLFQLQYYSGITCFRTSTPRETAHLVINLHNMFQRPPEDHTSLNHIYTPPLPVVPLDGKASLLRRVAKELPGVGWELSGRAEKEFGSVREMINADEERWENIDKIGPGKSGMIVSGIRSGGKDDSTGEGS